MSSIAIGGANINKISTPNGNSSLDVTGQTNLRNKLFAVDTVIKSSALNVLTIQNASSGQAVRIQFADTTTGYNSYIENKLAGDLTFSSNDNLYVNAFNILYLNSINSSIEIGALNDINFTCVSGNVSMSASNISMSASNISTIGNQSVSGTLSCSNLTVSGNETIGGTLDVTSNTTLSGTLSVNGNTTLNSPIIANYIPNVATSNTMIGYTNSVSNTGQTFSGTASDNSTPAQVGTFTLPSKGVWFIQMDVLITLNTGSDTITDRSICLSEASASLTECAPGFKYSDPINDGAGNNGARQTIIFSGIYHLVSSSTKPLYVNAIVITSGSRTVTCSGNYKYTRIA